MRRYAFVLVALLGLVVACVGNDGDEKPTPTPPITSKDWVPPPIENFNSDCLQGSQRSPLLLGVADDISGSTTGNQRITVKNLADAIDRIRCTGGEIALATIGDRPNEPLIRLRVRPSPAAPADMQSRDRNWKSKCDNLGNRDGDKCRADENTKYKNTVEAHNDVVRDAQNKFNNWKHQTVNDTAEFNNDARVRLERPQSGATDVFMPLGRLLLFMREPTAGWLGDRKDVLRALVLNTDGEHTTSVIQTKRPSKEDLAGIELYVVNGAGKVHDLEYLTPTLFESFSSALSGVIAAKGVAR